MHANQYTSGATFDTRYVIFNMYRIVGLLATAEASANEYHRPHLQNKIIEYHLLRARSTQRY